MVVGDKLWVKIIEWERSVKSVGEWDSELKKKYSGCQTWIKFALHKAFFLAKASVAMRIYNHLAFPFIYSK